MTQEPSTELVPSFPECDRGVYSEMCQRIVPKWKSATARTSLTRG